MLLSLKFTRKIWTAMCVTQRMWLELSVWRTSMSSLKGWQWNWKPSGGFTAVTPVVGVGVCTSFGRNND